MSKLLELFNFKKEAKNLIYDPCCNNCLNCKIEYLNGISGTIEGIDCILDKNIEHKFDYICESYERDEVFIEYNKKLERDR